MGVVAGLILPPLNKQRIVFGCISCVMFHLLSVWDLRIHLAQNEKSIHHPVDVFLKIIITIYQIFLVLLLGTW